METKEWKKIVLVDRNDGFALAQTQFLEKNGYEVTHCSTFAELIPSIYTMDLSQYIFIFNATANIPGAPKLDEGMFSTAVELIIEKGPDAPMIILTLGKWTDSMRNIGEKYFIKKKSRKNRTLIAGMKCNAETVFNAIPLVTGEKEHCLICGNPTDLSKPVCESCVEKFKEQRPKPGEKNKVILVSEDLEKSPIYKAILEALGYEVTYLKSFVEFGRNLGELDLDGSVFFFDTTLMEGGREETIFSETYKFLINQDSIVMMFITSFNKEETNGALQKIIDNAKLIPGKNVIIYAKMPFNQFHFLIGFFVTTGKMNTCQRCQQPTIPPAIFCPEHKPSGDC